MLIMHLLLITLQAGMVSSMW